MTSSDTLVWNECYFSQLTSQQIYLLIKLRVDVFVVEQFCAYTELDGRDLEDYTMHVFATSNGIPVAYARVLTPPDFKKTNTLVEPESIYIGRVVVAKPWRGQGVARALMQRVLNHCQQHYPSSDQALSAQVQIKAFYTSLGFVTCSDEYMEDGIAHVDMRRRVNS